MNTAIGIILFIAAIGISLPVLVADIQRIYRNSHATIEQGGK